MTTQPPISDELLMAYLLGELPAAERERIENAADASPQIAQSLDHFRQVLADIRGAGAVASDFEVTPEQMSSLRRMGSALRPVAAGESMGLAERVWAVAVMVFDSWANPAVPGFRSGGLSSERLLRFEFPGGSVDIRISPDPTSLGRFWIIGEAHGDKLRGVGIKHRPLANESGAQQGESVIGDDGYFEFAVASGEHTLEIESESGRIAIGPLSIGGH